VNGRWTLPLQDLLKRITPATKLLVLNSPNNPTGWTLSREEQRTLLAHCRQTGTWILADEVYENLYYLPTSNACAPSFLDICTPDERLVVAHSFSKSFLMTGWRCKPPNGWWPRPVWAWPRAARSRPRRKAGCAGVSPPKTCPA
jgi:aspartate/methionine/tyrosine aminotransferase